MAAPTGSDAWERGRAAEDHVAGLLEADGWSIRSRNWRGDGGELDLVVERGGVLRFVEVKARAVDDAEAGLDAIGATKRRRLRSAGDAWLAAHGLPDREVAFLVVVVTLDPAGWTVERLDDAF
ncbi:MAG: YraN family protein [Myxococcota bacterium]